MEENKMELETLLKERVRAELKLCGVKEIDEEKLDYAYRLAMSEHLDVIDRCAVAEYFLLIYDLELAKYHSKEYRKILKELL